MYFKTALKSKTLAVNKQWWFDWMRSKRSWFSSNAESSNFLSIIIIWLFTPLHYVRLRFWPFLARKLTYLNLWKCFKKWHFETKLLMKSLKWFSKSVILFQCQNQFEHLVFAVKKGRNSKGTLKFLLKSLNH